MPRKAIVAQASAAGTGAPGVSLAVREYARTKLSELYQMYEYSLETKNLTKRSIETARQRLGRFFRWLENRVGHVPTLSDFTRDVISEYSHWMQYDKTKWDDNDNLPTQDVHLSAETVKGYLRNLKAFAHWLHDEGKTTAYTLYKMPMPKVDEPLIRPLSEEEINRVYAHIKRTTQSGARDYAVVTLLLDCGLRESEVCALTVETVHLKTGILEIPKAKSRRGRDVKMTTRCQGILQQYKDVVRADQLHEYQPTNAFFVQRNGQPLQAHTIRSAMRQLAIAADVPRLHAHLLRHTMATRYLAVGGDSVQLQQMLGHTTLSMTTKYVHLNDQAEMMTHRLSTLDHIAIPRLNYKPRKRKEEAEP